MAILDIFKDGSRKSLYEFKNNLLDSTGLNHLIPPTVEYYDFKDSQSNLGLYFDVINGSSITPVLIPNHPDVSKDNTAISFWVKLQSPSYVTFTLMLKGTDVSHEYKISNTTNGDITYSITGDNGQSVFVSTGAGTIVANTWHHIVCVKDTVFPRIYLDGILKAQTQIYSLPIRTTSSATLLKQFGGASINNLSYFDRAIDDAEAKKLYLEKYIFSDRHIALLGAQYIYSDMHQIQNRFKPIVFKDISDAEVDRKTIIIKRGAL